MIFVEKTELSDEETATTFNISSTQQEGASELVRQSGGEREREREREAGGWEVNGGGVGCLNSLMLQIVSEKERGAERARTK